MTRKINPEEKKSLKKIVLENRSLAENNPQNLLKYDECQNISASIGEAEFDKEVNQILDADE